MPVHMCGSMADLGALKAICEEHDLILLEDACQALGGSYKGKPLGSYGDLGCFSFDYVKTITCGEGGAVITNNEAFAKHAHQYSDHGHDHIGNDRGAEEHPFLGYNFRISELNAAVGLAQLSRLDEFLTIQKKNYMIIRKELNTIPELVFRTVPEGGEENYSFLNFYLPTEKITRKAHKAILENGIDGCFYWFDNNWHYIKKWQHLIEQRTLGKLSSEVSSGLTYLKTATFEKSDYWMGRTISCLIKLSWKEEDVLERANKMKQVIQKVIKENGA